jgi:hypothetical protein
VPSSSDNIALQYIAEMRALKATGATTAETSFYPPLATLFNRVGDKLKPKVLFSTQLSSAASVKQPDGGFFPVLKVSKADGPLLGQRPERGVVEIKPAGDPLTARANTKQVRDYLRDFGLVLITNYHQFCLVRLDLSGNPEIFEPYDLTKSAEAFWRDPINTLADKHKQTLPDYLARVLLYQVPIDKPKDLAWLLASYAREAKARAEDHPLSSFATVKNALQESLGITFDGVKGENFFISTLIQTLFYGMFSAWILWRRSPESRQPNAYFNWRQAAWYLRIPVLRQLFNTVAEPGGLNAATLTEILDLAGDALNRVQPAFFANFREEDAVNYFYEPFLEAFDPVLRKELGVWYTPREIVHYMVERVDHLLRTELNQPLGLASPNVRILDPCCGTGAYLVAVLQRIHKTLLDQAGDDNALVSSDLRRAATTRIFGFEIMPAPFVIAHLQLAALLEDSGSPLAETDRAQVFLTNALTGWVPTEHPKAIFAEMEHEREAAENIKQHGNILVILGNPPYNGYAGIARIEEERDLSEAYRAPVPGVKPPEGQGLNELYVRFFRMAERRIAANSDSQGIACFISNNSWLDGQSHPSMRHHYLKAFQQIFVDNLNGDKYRTGKTTPEGLPDPSVFSTPQNREGIQPGTSVATLVRSSANPPAGVIGIRNLWGSGKLAQLERESLRETDIQYEYLTPTPVLGLPFANRVHTAQYTSWPRLPELLPISFPGIKTSRDPVVLDIDRDRLVKRMAFYLDDENSDETVRKEMPVAMTNAAGFSAAETRRSLISLQDNVLKAIEKQVGHKPTNKQVEEYLTSKTIPFCYRPFDVRWLYWEMHTNLIDRKREDYFHAKVAHGIAIVTAKSNRKEFDPPCITSSMASLHVVEKGSTAFPLHAHIPTLFHSNALHENISEAALNRYDGLNNPHAVFFHALAAMHTPAYRLENSGALLGDWPRIPLPASAELLTHSATLGRRLAELLDPESSIHLAAEWSFLARSFFLRRPISSDTSTSPRTSNSLQAGAHAVKAAQ